MSNYDACPVRRDSRDCTTCLFVNPLTNRCVNEGQDPMCEAARSAINARYERNREACIENAQAERDACDRLRAQEVRSCELEASMEISACESRKRQLDTLRTAGTVATVNGTATVAGDVGVSFSGFRIEGDLDRFWLNLGMTADLGVRGNIDFTPSERLGELANCVAGWRGDYATRVVQPHWESGLVSFMEETPDALVTTWSGFVHQMAISPEAAGSPVRGQAGVAGGSASWASVCSR